MALVRPTEARLIWTAVAAAASVGLLHVPIVNIPFVLAAWPLYWISRFGQSGPDVQWYFFGPLLRSPTAFVVFFAYFALIAYVLLFRLGYAPDDGAAQR
jgi:hypothetical protein